MRVLFISTEDAKYGAPKSMQKLMQTLRQEHNVECVLLTKKRNLLNEWCDEQGIENYAFNYRDIMAGDSYETWWLNTMKHIVKYFRYIKGSVTQKNIDKLSMDFSKIDLIHSNSNRVDIGAYISVKYNIPHIWHLREMDEGTKNMHYYRKDWAEYMNKSAVCFIAITEAVRDSWIRNGLDRSRIKVVYNGIDPENIIPRKGEILSGEKIKIAAVGRIERAKGQIDIINALCKMPEDEQKHFQLDFIGEAYADYKKLLTDRIKTEKCKSEINFLGYCENIGEILQQYDIGITCSAAEAFGRTTVEYMMAGLLTIASDTGANKELIKDKETGLIYSYGNGEELAHLLHSVVEKRSEYIAIASMGEKYARNRFCSGNNAEGVWEIYRSVV